MDDLKFRPGGGLKFKGKDNDNKKKKKRYLSTLISQGLPCSLCSRYRSTTKNPSKVALTGNEPVKSEALLKLVDKDKDEDKDKDTDKDTDGNTQSRNSPNPSGSQRNKTDAERRFEKVQRKRVRS
jgi:hypothetical protein